MPGGIASSDSQPDLAHLGDHPLLAFDGAFEVGVRVQTGGRLGQRREQRALGGTKVAERFGKVILRGGGAAAVEVAVIEAIEVGGENALFVPDLFEAPGLDSFDQLGAQGARAGLGELDELLGNGRAAGDDAPVQDELPGGADLARQSTPGWCQ